MAKFLKIQSNPLQTPHQPISQKTKNYQTFIRKSYDLLKQPIKKTLTQKTKLNSINEYSKLINDIRQ